MARNCQRRAAGRGIGLLLRLLLVVTVTFFRKDFFLPRGNNYYSRIGGNKRFALAFCDSNLAVRYKKPFCSTGKIVRETPGNFLCQGLRSPTTTILTTGTQFTTKISRLEAAPSLLSLGSEESLLLFWVSAFSFSHIGMSAIRQTLITDIFGKFLANDLLGIVGTGKLRLPSFWPGDSSGTNELFPDIETTGRQFYRIFYTMVSFVTLGASFSTYLGIRGSSENDIFSTPHKIVVGFANAFGTSGGDGGEFIILFSYAIATLSGAFSLTSLINASPLGLMPSFRQKEDDGSGFNATLSSTTDTTTAAGDTLLGITRDDELKFDPKGLTRITRHPLILPVFPWGVANYVLVGGRASDAILFCGLSLYSISGCYCQDLRVLREEGSVGTTFFVSNEDICTSTAAQTKTTIDQKLKSFYDDTSFLPFRALLDGRQSWVAMAREFPILPFLIAIPSAFVIETTFLRFLGVEYTNLT